MVTDPKHCLFQTRALLPPDPAIVDSMVRYGWIGGAIEVRTDGDRRLVSKGRQRRNAAIEANKIRARRKLAPVMVLYTIAPKGDDKYFYETGIVENTATVKMGPASKGLEIPELRRRGYDEEGICRILSVTVEMLPIYEAVNDLDPSLFPFVESGELAISLVPKFARMSREAQVAKWAEMQSDGATKGGKAKRALGGEVKVRPLPPGKVARIRDALMERQTGRELAQLLDVINGGPIAACEPWLAEIIREALSKPVAAPVEQPATVRGVKKDGTPKAKPGRKKRAA